MRTTRRRSSSEAVKHSESTFRSATRDRMASKGGKYLGLRYIPRFSFSAGRSHQLFCTIATRSSAPEMLLEPLLGSTSCQVVNNHGVPSFHSQSSAPLNVGSADRTILFGGWRLVDLRQPPIHVSAPFVMLSIILCSSSEATDARCMPRFRASASCQFHVFSVLFK